MAACFAAHLHVRRGYQLTAAVAFPALSLFNLLRFPIIMFPSQVCDPDRDFVVVTVPLFVRFRCMNRPNAQSLTAVPPLRHRMHSTDALLVPYQAASPTARRAVSFTAPLGTSTARHDDTAQDDP